MWVIPRYTVHQISTLCKKIDNCSAIIDKTEWAINIKMASWENPAVKLLPEIYNSRQYCMICENETRYLGTTSWYLPMKFPKKKGMTFLITHWHQVLTRTSLTFLQILNSSRKFLHIVRSRELRNIYLICGWYWYIAA